jgi:hypothetical protein
VTGLAALAVFLVVVLALLAAQVPTAQDARVSEQIRREFAQAISTNLPPGERFTVDSSPRRHGTVIIVTGGSLTAAEKVALALQARQLGRQHANRQVTVVFRNQ